MTQYGDYDADLARQLDARLADFAPLSHIARTPRSDHRLRLVATAAFGAIALTAAGVGFEANAYAETQGFSCLDAMTKVQVYASTLADQFRGASIEEQRAAKQRLNEYALSQAASSPGCFSKDPNGGVEWRPQPSPSGAIAPEQKPQGTFDPSRTPKPTNPVPSPTGRP